MTSTNPKSTNLIDRDMVNEMIENAIRRHNRRSTIISAILGWILIGGYSFGLFHVVQNIWIKAGIDIMKSKSHVNEISHIAYSLWLNIKLRIK